MNDKQRTFCEEYLIDLNAKQAAIRAGYSEHTAEVQGCRLLSNVKVAEEIARLKAERSKRTQVTADNVINELAKLGFGNIKNLYDADGNLLHPQDLPAEVAATIQEVTEETIGKKGEEELNRRKYKVADKKASLELLGKHLKLFTDKIEQETSLTITRKTYGT